MEGFTLGNGVLTGATTDFGIDFGCSGTGSAYFDLGFAYSSRLHRAGVVDEVGARDWFFLSKSNALTMTLSSATSDEMAGVDELVPTLATTALARD
nr:hypothetical protein [Tanacetum cinerariifolium]